MPVIEKEKKRRKESLTEHEKLNRMLVYKRKFRATVRNVINNRPWLEEMDPTASLGDNVKQNFLLIVKKKKRTDLKLEEKALLRKPTKLRTPEEMQKIFSVIGGLKCFTKYDEQVQRQLAGRMFFEYYGHDRCIVRQHHEGLKLFVLSSGKVSVSQQAIDPATGNTVSFEIGFMEKGEMFGEFSLLHGRQRLATVTTIGDCEFLTLNKVDFNEVLKKFLIVEWNRIENAMSQFTYFNGWNNDTKRECCILSKMKTYEAGETVAGDLLGETEYTFFLLKGSCQLVEHLLVTSVIRNGVKYFQLWKPPESEESKEVNWPSSLRVRSTIGRLSQIEPLLDHHNIMLPSIPFQDYEQSTIPSETIVPTQSSLEYFQDNLEDFFTHTLTETEELRTKRLTVVSAHMLHSNIPSFVETYYMQLCIFKELSCFSIGEYLKNRRIIALTPIEVLAIPRYFLFDKNVGNIWTKIQQFLNLKIPSSDRVFKEFVKLRKWERHCKEMKKPIIKYRSCCYGNSLSNVPYYIRIRDQLKYNTKKEENYNLI